jgi:hypothetical protein
MRDSVVLSSVETWPEEVLKFLDAQYEMLLAYARRERLTMDEYLAPKSQYIPMSLMPSNEFTPRRERAVANVLDLLQSSQLRGWHCTRLTESEIQEITQNGMRLPNLKLLQERISQVQAIGLIDKTIAERLRCENQADDPNRWTWRGE